MIGKFLKLCLLLLHWSVSPRLLPWTAQHSGLAQTQGEGDWQPTSPHKCPTRDTPGGACTLHDLQLRPAHAGGKATAHTLLQPAKTQ